MNNNEITLEYLIDRVETTAKKLSELETINIEDNPINIEMQVGYQEDLKSIITLYKQMIINGWYEEQQ